MDVYITDSLYPYSGRVFLVGIEARIFNTEFMHMVFSSRSAWP